MADKLKDVFCLILKKNLALFLNEMANIQGRGRRGGGNSDHSGQVGEGESHGAPSVYTPDRGMY